MDILDIRDDSGTKLTQHMEWAGCEPVAGFQERKRAQRRRFWNHFWTRKGMVGSIM